MKIKLAHIILVLLFALGCGPNQNEVQLNLDPVDNWTIENLSEDKFNHCNPQVNCKLSKITDTPKIFSIELPSNWLVLEDILDDLHGIVSSDTSEPLECSSGISVAEIKNDSTELDEYFKQEILSALTQDNELKVLNAGKAKVAGMKAYWLSYQPVADTLNQMSYLYYFKNNKKNSYFYLVETATYGNYDIDQRHCDLRQIVETFKFLE